MEVAFVGTANHTYNVFPSHSHGYWEIMYNRKGSGIMHAGGSSYPFAPGDIAVIPPNMKHKKESEEGFEDFCLFFKNFRNIGPNAFLILHDDERHTVSQLMDTAAHYNNMDNVLERAILNSLGDLLYQTLVLLYTNAQPRDLRLEGVLEEMRDNITNPDYDLADTIEKSGYCAGYFRKIFKESTNQSPVEYMQNLRINYAKSQMNQFGNSRSIKDIAQSSGFHDPLYFSRIFKKITGMSPRDYERYQFVSDPNEIVSDAPKEEESL